MKDFVKRMIEEHSQLVDRVNVLTSWIYQPNCPDNPIEFTNKCIQLKGMEMYEEGLRARLENQNIFFDEPNRTYYEQVAKSIPNKPEDKTEENNNNNTDSEKVNEQ